MTREEKREIVLETLHRELKHVTDALKYKYKLRITSEPIIHLPDDLSQTALNLYANRLRAEIEITQKKAVAVQIIEHLDRRANNES